MTASWSEVLDAQQREALHDAIVITLGYCFDDLILVETQDASPPDLDATMAFAIALPSATDHLYGVNFLRAFTVSMTVVGWKLEQEGRPQLTCTAEELAFRAILLQTEELLELREIPHELLGDFRGEVVEDFDVDYLFDPKYDGIETGELADQLRPAGLAFDEWFKPFGSGSRGQPHPYCTDE